VVNRTKTAGGGGRTRPPRIRVPVLSRGIQKIQQTAADAVDRGISSFAGSDRLVDVRAFSAFRACHGMTGVVDVEAIAHTQAHA